MIFILKRNASKREIEELDNILYKKKLSGGFNAKKYNGIWRLKEDPLIIQKKLRDEWERDPG